MGHKQDSFKKSLVVNKNNNHKFSNESSKKLKKILSNEELSFIIQQMSEKIINDYKDKQVGLICVDYGARPFYNLLVENLQAMGLKNFYQGYVRVQTDSTKTTEDRETSRFVYESGILCDKKELKKTHLVVIDDQINKGRTWDLIKKRYSKALSVELAALVIRPDAISRLKSHDVKYPGFVFDMQNSRIVGFGMDHKEYFRQEPISVVPKNSGLDYTKKVAGTSKNRRTRTNTNQPHQKKSSAGRTR